MPMELAAWNVKEGLGQPERMPKVVEAIKRLNKQLVILSDAFSLTNGMHESHPDVLQAAYNKLKQEEDYDVYHTEYGKKDNWHHDRNLVVLSRLAVTHSHPVLLKTRNAYKLEVRYPDSDDLVDIFGLHLDDREEWRRVLQVKSFMEIATTDRPTVLGGDLNCMHGDDRRSRLLRSKAARSLLPHAPAKIEDYGERLVEMASGDTLKTLEHSGFYEADHAHRPTYRAVLPLFQLDHFLHSEHITVEDFQTHYMSGASDHRAISMSAFI